MLDYADSRLRNPRSALDFPLHSKHGLLLVGTLSLLEPYFPYFNKRDFERAPSFEGDESVDAHLSIR